MVTNDVKNNLFLSFQCLCMYLFLMLLFFLHDARGPGLLYNPEHLLIFRKFSIAQSIWQKYLLRFFSKPVY